MTIRRHPESDTPEYIEVRTAPPFHKDFGEVDGPPVVDEIVGYGSFQLEQLDDDEWCLNLGHGKDGPYLLAYLYRNGDKVLCNVVETRDARTVHSG